MSEREVYPIEIAGVHRELQKFEVQPGLTIAILNILGDTELVDAAAHALAEKLKDINPDTFITAEAKAIPLAHVLSTVMQKPYIVLRKTYKSYMGDAIKSETLSITTGKPQTLYLDEKDRKLIEGKRVAIVDDVISTGSTLEGLRKLVTKANGEIVAECAILTEGDPDEWQGIIALGHLPVWTDE